MAWKAKVIQHIQDGSATRIAVEIGWWDDAVIANPVEPDDFAHRKTYPGSELTTIDALLADVNTIGQQLQAEAGRVNAIKNQLPVGASVTIPPA